MLSDVFYTRYPETYYYGNEVSPAMHSFFTQVGHIIFEDICSNLSIPIEVFTNAHRKLAREIGLGRLGPGKADDEVCGRLLYERYDLWDNRHGDAGYFVKVRFSVIELIFRELERFVDNLPDSKGSHFFKAGKTPERSEYKKALRVAIDEMNSRFKLAGLPLHYHNGYIQFKDDDMAAAEAEEAFWDLIKDKKWENVDLDIKEAIDRRDNNKKDAVFYAFKALESTIKIISDEKGFTSGGERGAGNFIDNLVSKKNGRLIEPWEADILKLLFSALRNPQGHGSGSNPQPQLQPYQIDHAIETSMSWIKSLVKRSV